MPQTLTIAQIDDLKIQAHTNGVGSIGDVYGYLESQGYQYGGWAAGVAAAGGSMAVISIIN